ncbi:MAG: M28 family peptidase [Terriglobales bacterium]
MHRSTTFAVVAGLVLAGVLVAGSQTAGKSSPRDLPSAAQAAMKSIDAERLRAHVRFLSHDLLEGRGTGARGGDIAAQYLAAQFALYGLEPAGDNGSYLQNVPLVGVITVPQDTTYALAPAGAEEMKLTFLNDYVVMDETQSTTSHVDADMVFVGYGISAPEFNWDDYKGVDLKGKVLLMLVNEPPSDDAKFFKGPALTYYGRWTYKFEEAARRGAVGAVLIHKTEMASYGWDVVRNSWSGERSYLKAQGPKLQAASWIQLEVARKALASAGKNLDELMESAKSRDFRPVPLAIEFKAHVVSKVRPFESSNVIARLPGSNPKLKDQAVLYTAHYDHLGIRPNAPGDNIFNGAEDNATGCAVLLELARAYATAARKPARSILFATVTAEEQGLLGSEYLGLHPPIPAGRIVLNLNFDNIPPLGVPEHVQASGSERTTFYSVVEATAKGFGLEIMPDSNPGAGYFYRSDHFSMARVGVPAFSVNAGQKFKGHSLEWGDQKSKEYRAKRYHQPSDEYRPEMDFASGRDIARFGLALGWRAATSPKGIEWLPGDEFEAARKASRK